MRVEGCVVNFRKRDSIRDHWLTKPIVFIGNDVRSVEQQRFGKARKRTASIVSCYYRFPECCLMQPLLDRAQRVSSLHAVCGGAIVSGLGPNATRVLSAWPSQPEMK